MLQFEQVTQRVIELVEVLASHFAHQSQVELLAFGVQIVSINHQHVAQLMRNSLQLGHCFVLAFRVTQRLEQTLD